jgi:hypothetical protein
MLGCRPEDPTAIEDHADLVSRIVIEGLRIREDRSHGEP